MNQLSFKIVTFGCRVNQAESRMMGEKIIQQLGMNDLREGGKVDIVIINTCCVTHKAEREVRKEIRRVKRENPRCFLVVCGCWVDKIQSEKLASRRSGRKAKNNPSRLDQSEMDNLKLKIDLLIRNEEKEKIVEILKERIVITHTWPHVSYGQYGDKYTRSKKALVKIQDGCDNFCTYCIVPYVRGGSKSRYTDEIVNEVNGLVEQGIEEMVLVGVDIASYKFKIHPPNILDASHRRFSRVPLRKSSRVLGVNAGENNLAQLIKLILVETKIKKISFGSMGLDVFDEEFMGLHKENNRLSSHFHIPLQSGCNATLKRMRRRYAVEKFKSQILNLKSNIPDFSFSTDIIVGFPGETDEEFEQTIRTIKAIRAILRERFTHVHIFRYSSRTGTIAQSKEGQKGWEKVNEKVKKQRAARVNRLLN